MNSDAYARTDVLVDTEWLDRHLGDPSLRVIEVDVSPAAYREGHIPGAVLWNIYQDIKDAGYHTVDRAAVEQLVQRSGITRESELVFYGYAPALGFWLMALYGHPRLRILNATRTAWQAEGRPWTSVIDEPVASQYPLPEEDARLRAQQQEVAQAIDATGRVILDVRTEPEYQGQRFWPSGSMEEGGRAGHIPSAAHLPLDGLQDARGAFLPPAELRRHFAGLDLTEDREVIPYCTIGGRACTAWFVLHELLGHERTRVYDGSWAEWGRMPSAPVSTAV